MQRNRISFSFEWTRAAQGLCCGLQPPPERRSDSPYDMFAGHLRNLLCTPRDGTAETPNRRNEVALKVLGKGFRSGLELLVVLTVR